MLLSAAEAAQIDGAESLLDGPGMEEEVWSKVERAYQSGVSGVPHFRISLESGDGPAREVSGGQPPEVFLQLFAELTRGGRKPPAAALAEGNVDVD